MNLIIVDDELPALEAIANMVTLYCPQAKVTGTFSSIEKAVEAIKTQRPDLLLLDIEVGKESGFDILKYFPRPTFKVVFITAYQQYALEAFRFSALDYLLKPVHPDLLANAVNKAADLLDMEKLGVKIDSFLHNVSAADKHNKRVVLKTTTDVHVLHISEIMYCQADHSYTTFYLADKRKIMVSSTLGNYEEMLRDFGFMRIHQSYLLNLDYLSRYEKGEGGNAILKDQTSLPVATRKKDQFLQMLSKL